MERGRFSISSEFCTNRARNWGNKPVGKFMSREVLFAFALGYKK